MTDDAKGELLPCPFCGSRAYAGDDGVIDRPLWSAYCGQCDAAVENYQSREDVVAQWNRRALAPAQAQRDPNSGHGHVYPRPDGVSARCGGPGVCAVCSREAAQAQRVEPEGPITMDEWRELLPMAYGKLAALNPWAKEHSRFSTESAAMNKRDRDARNPGGMECERCGCIFVGAEWHTICGECVDAASAAPYQGSDLHKAAVNEYWKPLLSPAASAEDAPVADELRAAQISSDTSRDELVRRVLNQRKSIISYTAAIDRLTAENAKLVGALRRLRTEYFVAGGEMTSWTAGKLIDHFIAGKP